MHQSGVRVRLHTEAGRLLIDENEKTVTGVQLKNGDKLNADKIIVATGVFPMF